mmetsp:Transcript_51540/g.76901  ORF Transcript_51540/g.76901 Transcript_51540/m.76901 type:complete len:115 (-) Transcript_51540:2697-3041(-)
MRRVDRYSAEQKQDGVRLPESEATGGCLNQAKRESNASMPALLFNQQLLRPLPSLVRSAFAPGDGVSATLVHCCPSKDAAIKDEGILRTVIDDDAGLALVEVRSWSSLFLLVQD